MPIQDADHRHSQGSPTRPGDDVRPRLAATPPARRRARADRPAARWIACLFFFLFPAKPSTGYPIPFRHLSYTSIDISPDGDLLAAGCTDGPIRIWDLRTRRPALALVGHAGPVNSVAFSRDGKTVISGGEDGSVKLWNLANLPGREEQQTLNGVNAPINSIALSPDGRHVAAGGDDRLITVFDLADGTRRSLLQGSWTRELAYSPDGSVLAACDQEDNLSLWKGETKYFNHTFSSKYFLCLAFRKKDSALAIGCMDRVYLMDVDKPGPPPFKGEIKCDPSLSLVQSVKFTNDSKYLIIGGLFGIQKTRCDDRKSVFFREEPIGLHPKLAITPDDSLIAVVSRTTGAPASQGEEFIFLPLK